MAILKNRTQGNYVTVSQMVMRDKRLGITERGLLVTLLSLPDEWNLSIKGLQCILPDGREKLTSALNHLIELGYITMYQDRASGKFANNIYEINETPVEDIPPEDRYICRKDKAGIIYDRKAMLYASKQLGHNRIDVIANSYLHDL